jgi:DNA-binding NarL/FixJ family response regulator
MLTTFDDDENLHASLRASASGFLVEGVALDDILAAMTGCRESSSLPDALACPGLASRARTAVDRAHRESQKQRRSGKRC